MGKMRKDLLRGQKKEIREEKVKISMTGSFPYTAQTGKNAKTEGRKKKKKKRVEKLLKKERDIAGAGFSEGLPTEPLTILSKKGDHTPSIQQGL